MEDRALLWVTLNLINTLSRGVFLFRHNQSGSRGVKWKLFVCTWLYNLVWVSTVTFVSIWIKVRPDLTFCVHITLKFCYFCQKFRAKFVTASKTWWRHWVCITYALHWDVEEFLYQGTILYYYLKLVMTVEIRMKKGYHFCMFIMCNFVE